MDESKKTMIIDPPDGWRWGFPKPIPQGYLKNESLLRIWLTENGYPDNMVVTALNHSRYWESSVDNDGWYDGRASRDNMSSPGDKDYD